MDDEPLRRLGSARLEIQRQLAELDDKLMTAAAETFGVRLDAIERRLEAIAHAQAASQGGPVDASLVLPEPACDPTDHPDTGAPTEAGPPWESIVFGEELANEQAIESDRAALLDDLRRGDPAAGCLVGQLLVFHSAALAQKPQLLKELGEAYYRWQPMERGPERPLELALSAWLEKACEAAGTRRKILLVRIGSRFNTTYHRAIDRGGEIIEVLGWVVLREDGSVYQKALVGVR